MRKHANLLLLGALLATASIAACGADAEGDAPPPGANDAGETSSSSSSSGGSSGVLPSDSGRDAEVDPDRELPDLPPDTFPLELPSVFGYRLVEAFPGTFISGAIDIEWPAGSIDPYMLQRGGHIVRLHGADSDRDLVLDFSEAVQFDGEAGALGMALHPKFADAADPRPYVYVWYNAKSPREQRLSRFTYNPATRVFDRGSELMLVRQAEGTDQHNSAQVRFGPDGFLYFGNGDDVRPNDTTQRLNAGLFSGIFRIDVDARGGAVSHPPTRQPTGATTTGYYIPNDNPFVGQAGVNEEYYALGFRNPYRFNFDRQSGDLWMGDVGDTFREEINRVIPGGNYGWPFYEGTLRNQAGEPSIGTPQQPALEYPHWGIADLCAVTAGYVYRGSALPELQGKFIFSDWALGRVWMMDPNQPGVRRSLYEGNWEVQPQNLGQDNDGELYWLGWQKILKLVRDPAPAALPQKLSETHLFRRMVSFVTTSELHPYTLRSPLWSDGAEKKRWVYVPEGQQATVQPDGTLALPPGSVLVKHFELPADARPVNGRTRRLETRVLVTGTSETYGLTYRWNAAGTDADLVTEAIHETIQDEVAGNDHEWHYPSTGECWSCHRASNRVLGFRGEQLNFPLEGGQNQLEALSVFDPASLTDAPAPLVSPSDESADIDARASAYMASNCAPCHHQGASYLGGVTWYASPGLLPSQRELLGRPHHNYPMARAFDLVNAPLVDPGNPDNSILLARIGSADPDLRMPPLGRSRVDPVGSAVIRAWIQSLAP